MKIPNQANAEGYLRLSLARIVSEDSQQGELPESGRDKSSKDS